MANRDFIFAPETVSLKITYQPVLAIFNSMVMLNAVEEYPGMDEWLSNTYQNMTNEQRHRHRLVFDGFYNVFPAAEATNFDNVPAYIDYIEEELSPQTLQDRFIEKACELPQKKRAKSSDLQALNKDAFLTSTEAYIDYMRELYSEKEHEVDEAFLREVYELVMNPSEMKSLIVQHMRWMWRNYVAKEWQRVTPMLEETVEAFQSLDYSGMSALDITRAITGRDMSGTWVGDLLENAQRALLIFTPLPHIGPYVTAHEEAGNVIRVGFGPRLPEGMRAKTPALDRSELLVRLNALADDIRLRILDLFRSYDELCAQDIIQMLDLSQSAASRHLRQLTATRYLTERRREGAKCYALNIERVEDTLEALQRFLIGK